MSWLSIEGVMEGKKRDISKRLVLLELTVKMKP